MYLINFLNLQTAEQHFIATSRYRMGVDLLGNKDGSNVVYTVPSGDKFTHNLPFLSIQVYFNGQKLRLLDDYTVGESGGVGTGFDTITLEIAPISRDKLFVDYVALASS